MDDYTLDFTVDWDETHCTHSDGITFAVNGEDVPSPDDVLAYIAWINEEDYE